MSTYCDYCTSHPEDTFNSTYHNTQYGFPLEDDNLLFERLVLEINQAGLSWITILKKAEHFHKAYHGFDIQKIAKYREKDRARLLTDAGIIRNKLKVNAAIVNAGKILELKQDFGSFKGWLEAHHPLTKEEWTKLFKKTFVFTGGEIVNEFLMSTGYLPGAHDADCPIYPKVAALQPACAIIHPWRPGFPTSALQGIYWRESPTWMRRSSRWETSPPIRASRTRSGSASTRPNRSLIFFRMADIQRATSMT